MFGISFSELLLVGLVALLVLGPERLPGAARTAGLWIGRLKRSFNAIKQEVEREIGADEIRRQLHNEHILSLEEEARKIMSPQQSPANPPPATGQTPAEPAEPVVSPIPNTPSVTPATDLGPAAPAGTTPAAEPKTVEATTQVATEPAHVTPATPAPNAPSANDSSLPPRAP
ncbi:Sec-independent protein translocase protein TatB [Pseudomonas folii]|uniref:Sec-independent protein translocase protein TatB n=1 Tax=Pseudomonas folii TaxID=2762593 RepID=A0ABR7B752_9PSED|nr:Sec-independent protein translocase protein TatB [Pseudomonas folii]MBC3952998.1 Sec-independent protein translocase subunit TatB [Pseudomonas folii]